MKSINQKKLNKFEKIKQKIVRRVCRYFNFPLVHQYKNFSILLPPNHLLPIYQSQYPNYDRFLPHLAKYLDSSDVIVDIGANIGDTLAGMVSQNSLSTYICIEPDSSFFEFLENNIARMKGSISSLKVEPIQALVGKNISNVSLEGRGGTKHAVVDRDGHIKSRPLDEIISSSTRIRLLKSDVDGFDYDVLDSSVSMIKKHQPIIFFECQCDYEYQKKSYFKTLQSLADIGYTDWTIFDNFGAFLLRTDDLNVINRLINYVWCQNTGKTTRTIYYYDILAVNEKDSELIDCVLKDY